MEGMSTATLSPTDLKESLQRKAADVESLVSPPASVDERPTQEGGPSSRERRGEWLKLVQDSVLDLVNTLPAGVNDYEARKLLEFMVVLGQRVAEDADARDRDGEVALASQNMLDVVRRMARRLEHDVIDEDPQTAARIVLQELDSVGPAAQADLLGVSTKTIKAWKDGGLVRQHKDRVVLLAQLLTYLRSQMTPRGIVMWFHYPADALDGATPLSLLASADPSAHLKLLNYTRAGRG